jgi:hypothetical protein
MELESESVSEISLAIDLLVPEPFCRAGGVPAVVDEEICEEAEEVDAILLLLGDDDGEAGLGRVVEDGLGEEFMERMDLRAKKADAAIVYGW